MNGVWPNRKQYNVTPRPQISIAFVMGGRTAAAVMEDSAGVGGASGSGPVALEVSGVGEVESRGVDAEAWAGIEAGNTSAGAEVSAGTPMISGARKAGVPILFLRSVSGKSSGSLRAARGS